MKTFTGYQKFVIGILAFLQFTIILDFMIMSPLGAMLMPALQISPAQFGTVVSAYAFSAGISGLLAAGFADRYDRKKLLLFFYVGFVIGTLFCGLAPNYHFLLAARVVTGLFGGVIGSVVSAITTDLFPFEVRGRVMGIISTAFAASQILGIPIGLFLANHWGWHFPFIMIVVVSSIVGVLIWMKLQPIDGHLKTKVDRQPVHHLWITLINPRYTIAFAATALLSLGGYLLMPFGSAYTVHNLGIEIDKLPLIYGVTGVTAIVIVPMVGRAADAFGKFNVFVFGSLLSVAMVLYYTNMGVSPIWEVILVNAIMFVGIFSRMIPSQVLMSALPTPDNRGAFMAISSSLQQIAGGMASSAAGLIVAEGPNGRLEHFEVLGYVMVVTAAVTLAMVYQIHRRVPQDKAVPLPAATH